MLTPGMVGFCKVEVNPDGPFQEYEAPPGFAFSDKVFPEQTVELLEAVTAGVGFTTTEVVPAVLVQPTAEEAVTE